MNNKYQVEDEFKVILTQPNIDPWDAKFVKTNTNLDFFNIIKDLSKNELNNEYDFLVAPETYFAEGIGENVDYFEYTRLSDSISDFLKKFPNTNFISGISLYRTYQNEEKSPTRSANKIRDNVWIDYYNSAINLSNSKPFEVNHKTKLVVGTEFMPYKWILEPIIGNLMLDLGGTTVSKASQPISELNVFEHSTKDLKTIPIICYETVYGEFVSNYTNKGADFITIISNDAWWGNTAGHKHLLSYARLRAIENRRYIVRSANSGISSIINHKGEIISTLPYGEYGILTGTAKKVSGKTFYNIYGDFIARISIFISMSMLFIFFVKSNK
jgi:apolipoprotein N-acyltransferase